ncbi:GNAT family protein [Limibacter armeniacum]|uniref:GNAT family N-acetyltransferase n=1 Tax=Limibacter armeniacum TaxID=466084 RepID=UPI002FE5CBF9
MIKGKNIILRHLKEEDLDWLIEMMNDLSYRGEYMWTYLKSPHSIRENFYNTGFASPQNELFVITDLEGNRVGRIGHFLTVPYSTAKEIGYSITGAHGKGYATEAVNLLRDYLFNSTELNRLEIKTHPENIGSQKVALRNGFQLEGTLRGVMLVKGKFTDSNVYGLVRKDWEALNA